VLYDAIDDAIGTVTPRDARGWFNDRARYLAERPKPVRPPL
jgi:hypothetical protein